MDVYLDMTGTITDMDSENFALLKLAESIAKHFEMEHSPKEVMEKIEKYRKPFMDKRAVEYTPIRILVIDAVAHILNRKLNNEERNWIEKRYVDVHAQYVRLAEGAKEGLLKIREIANHMGIITDGDRPYTEALVESLNIENLFDSITTAEDVGVGKPNPLIFKHAMMLGKSAKKVHVGDSERRDVFGAKEAGMIAIKIGRETKYGDYLASNLKDAANIIAKIRP